MDAVTERELTFEITRGGKPYRIAVPRPAGSPGSVYGGGRVIADLQVGYPYEFGLLTEIRDLNLPAGSVAVDVGAHVGNHTIWLAVVCGLRVVAFEPSERSYRWLERNVELNGLGTPGGVDAYDDDVVVHRTALGAMPGLASWDATITGVVHPGMHGTVPMRTLDSYRLRDVSLVKIDVEGYEPDVLRGAAETLTRCRPIVYAEATSRPARVRIDEVLEPLGYRRDHIVVSISSPHGCWLPT